MGNATNFVKKYSCVVDRLKQTLVFVPSLQEVVQGRGLPGWSTPAPGSQPAHQAQPSSQLLVSQSTGTGMLNSLAKMTHRNRVHLSNMANNTGHLLQHKLYLSSMAQKLGSRHDLPYQHVLQPGHMDMVYLSNKSTNLNTWTKFTSPTRLATLK